LPGANRVGDLTFHNHEAAGFGSHSGRSYCAVRRLHKGILRCDGAGDPSDG